MICMTNDPSASQAPDPTAVNPPGVEYPPLFGPPPPGDTDGAAAPTPTRSHRTLDRGWPNLVWDGVLLFVVLAAVVVMVAKDGFSGGLDPLHLVNTAPLLILAMALGASMRVGTVNLAVAHIAVAAVFIYPQVVPYGEAFAWLAVLGATALTGVVIALAVVLLRTPAWAVSLFMAVALTMVFQLLRSSGDYGVSQTQLMMTPGLAWGVMGVVALASVVGGAVAMVPSVRRLQLRASQSVEQTGRSTPATAFTIIGALALSGALAGAAGILSMAPGGMYFQANGRELLYLCMALAILLFGGTSARGGRGGVIGTLCATILFYVTGSIVDALITGWISGFVAILGFLLVGMIVSRVLGGGPRDRVDDVKSEPTYDTSADVPVHEPEPGPSHLMPQEHGFAQTLPDRSAPPAPVDDAALQQYWPVDPAPGQVSSHSSTVDPVPGPPTVPAPSVVSQQPPPITEQQPPVVPDAAPHTEAETVDLHSATARPISPAAAESAPPGFEQMEPPPDPYQYRPPAQ